MHCVRIILGVILLSMVFLATQNANAQDDPNFEAGLKPYGTVNGGTIDTIDLSNGSLAIDIPLISYPQRGGKLSLDFDLHYENRGTYADLITDVYDDEGDTFYYSLGPLNLVHGFNIIQKGAVYGSVSQDVVYVSPLVWTDGGSVKESAGPLHQIQPTSLTAWEAIDGSGYQYFPEALYYDFIGVTVGPDGTRYTGADYIPGPTRTGDDTLPWGVPDMPAVPTKIEDTHGNIITYTSASGAGWVDTLDRTIPDPVSTSTSGCPSGPQTPTAAWDWALPSVNGGTYTILLCSITVPESYYYDFGYAVYSNTYNATQLQSVVLPNGTAWTFQYDMTGGTGDLLQITFPTGGTLSYTWQNPSALYCMWSHWWVDSRQVVTRTLGDGLGTAVTDYSYACTTGDTVTTTVQDGNGNQSTHRFTYPSALETEAKFFQSTTTLLKTQDTTYSSGPQFLPIQVLTTWPNGEESKVTHSYDSSATFYGAEYTYSGSSAVFYGTPSSYTGSYGREVSTSEYAFANGTPTSVVRTTNTGYLALSNSSYLANNLLDLVSSVQVTDGSTQRAYTAYTYDGVSLQSSGITTIGGATVHESSPPAGSYRGNLTSRARWLNTTSGYFTNYNTYNDTGTLYDSVDANGSSATDPNHMTSYTFDSTGTYATQIQYPPTGSTSHIDNFTYDVTSGLMLTHGDQNGQTTYYETSTSGPPAYDSMWRLTNVIFPDGGNVSYCYKDKSADSCSPSGTAPYYVFTKKIDSTHTFTEVGVVDGVGRIKQSQTVVPSSTCSGGVAYVNISYDGAGNKSFQSNPDCSSSISTGIHTAYDGLNRISTVTSQDGGTVTNTHADSTALNALCTTVTDQASKVRTTCVDGLGRMTGVWEDPSTADYETDYAYDTLDNLTAVSQSSSRARSFTYDSLSRLLTATNPEAGTVAHPEYGTITYTYDGDNNVLTKVAPQANQTSNATTTTSYCYDALNRMTQKKYSSGSGCPLSSPDVSYVYDGNSVPSGCSVGSFGYGSYPKPHRTAMCDSVGSEAWSYDTRGHALTDQRITNSYTKTFTYAYNYDGSIHTIAYPSGHTITYTPNVAGQQVSAVDSTGTTINYATSAAYTPFGALASVTNGASLVSARFYNSKLQPCRISAKYSGTVPGSCTVSSDTGNIVDLNYDFSLGTSDNGNVVGITNNRDTTRSQVFTYDALNRLAAAETTSTHSTSAANCWSEAYVYDQPSGPSPWGNLIHIDAGPSAYNLCTQEGFSLSSATAQNHLTTGTTPDFAYDSAGNVTNNTVYGFYYDAENRICSQGGTSCSTGTTYTYDGDGKRLAKSTGTLYWYGLNADTLLETDGSGSLANEYVFFTDKRIARRDSSNNIFYYFADHLSSSRVIVQDGSSPTICYEADFYPFGGERTPITNSCSQNYKFTGKERDSESNLDNFGARYMSSQYGRFMTPDWSEWSDPVPYADLDDPQTLNLYSYVRNNPLAYADRDGHTKFCVTTYNVDENGKSVPTTTCEEVPDPPSADEQKILDLAGEINKRNILANTAKIYGGSVVVGLTGGTACYYLCTETAAVSLAGESGTNLIESTNTLNKIVGGEQRELLKDFFKTGERPEGLSDRTLKIYKDIAQRAIDAGKDGLKVQAERIKMISNALK